MPLQVVALHQEVGSYLIGWCDNVRATAMELDNKAAIVAFVLLQGPVA